MKKNAAKKKTLDGAAEKTREPSAAKRHRAARREPADAAAAPDPRLLSRFRQLVERASFELRLADDLARGMGLDAPTTRPLRGARRHLSACLSQIKAEREARKKRACHVEE